MANFSTQLIKSVCMKCQLSSIVDTLRKWGRLSEDQIHQILGNRKPKTKVKMAQSILELVQNQEEVELTTDIAGDLELSYIQLHPMKKLWKVFKLSGGHLEVHLDPRILRSRLTRDLQTRWKDGVVYGNIGYYSGAVWLRIHLDTSRRKRPKNSNVRGDDYNHNNSVFLLHFPGSPYLIISNTRVKESTLLTQSLVRVFNAESLSNLQLSDRHVFSLADIALKKNHETSAVHKYRELDEKENPLSSCTDRKRKQGEDIFQEEEEEERIVDENKAEKRVRKMHVEKRFGPGPQPALEKLEYKFSLGFHSQLDTDSLSRDCKTEVQIRGTSVLNGLIQLANKGFMTFPLPRHITGVLADQRNSFTVVSSKSKSGNNSTNTSRVGTGNNSTNTSRVGTGNNSTN